jgi:hypothetical protein
MMLSPWLAVPLADYEGHMSAPEVGQYSVLSTMFAGALAVCRPASVAVVGIAGGNGLEHIDSDVTRRVVGIDINAQYLDEVSQRFSALPGLELHCADMNGAMPAVEPVDLVHAALIFEHAGTGRCLDNTLALVGPAGWLCAVLQLPSEAAPGVAQTRFVSIRGLSPHFAFVDPAWFVAAVCAAGFDLTREWKYSVPAGKAFWMGLFRRGV